MNYDWTELALKIGDDAKAIIDNDRANSSDGKVICFMTEHKSNPVLKWLETKSDDPGKYCCANCGEKYSISDHARWLEHGDNKKAYAYLCELAGVEVGRGYSGNAKTIQMPEIEKPTEPKETIEQIHPAIEPLSTQLHGRAKQYLSGRGISIDTMKEYKVTSTNEAIYFNYLCCGTVIKIKGRVIGDMGNSKQKYAFTPKGGTNALYGQHMYKKQAILAICEGEIDALSLHDGLKACGIDNMVLSSSVPSGSSSMSWIENSREFIDKFETVVLIPDNDKAGESFSDKASSELMMIKPVKICSLKKYKVNDVNELIQSRGKKVIGELIANASDYIPDFKVDLSKIPENQHDTYSKSGFFMLDKRYRGFRHGLLTLFTGHSGDGKTTVFRQIIIFNAFNRHRIGCLMGEESELIFRNMTIYQAYRGTSDKQFNVACDEWLNSVYTPKPELVKRFNDEIDPYISMFNIKHLQSKNRLQKLYEWIRFESVVHGTRLFIVDNLMRLETGLGDNIYSAQGDIIDNLKNICQVLNVHIVLIAHPKKLETRLIDDDSVSGSKKIFNTVDNVVVFQRFDKMDDKLVKKVMSTLNKDLEYGTVTAFFNVLKNRVYGELGYIGMKYNPETNTIHDLNPTQCRHYGWTIKARDIDQEDY